MKIEWNRRYTTVSIYTFLVLAGVVLFAAAIFNLPTVGGTIKLLLMPLIPVGYGFAIAYILNPVVRIVENKLLPLFFKKHPLKTKIARAISLMVTYLLLILILVTFFWVIIPQIINSITDIVSKLPHFVQVAETEARSLFAGLPQEFIPASAIETAVGSVGGILNSTYQILSKSIPAIINYTAGLASGIVKLLMGVVISFYFLSDKENFCALSKKIVYAVFPDDVVHNIIYVTRQSHSTFSSFITGQLVDSTIVGVLCFIGMTVMRMPDAVLISFLAGVTNVIPYFGPFIGAVPSFLIIFLQNPGQAWMFALFIVILQQVDANFLGPRIVGASIGLRPFWVLFAIMSFGSMMGMLGLFIGVPTFAVIYWLIRAVVEYRLLDKKLPIRTEAYSEDSPVPNGKANL